MLDRLGGTSVRKGTQQDTSIVERQSYSITQLQDASCELIGIADLYTCNDVRIA
jgi:hypothetical protein